MRSGISLLLPALLPSWRFFDYIAPSPRIQYALLDAQQRPLTEWLEFRPRAAQVSWAQMLARLFWNPHWNESLFMVSCAERLMERYSTHSEAQILARITAAWRKGNVPPCSAAAVQFRLLCVQRVGTQLQQQVCFTSKAQALPQAAS